jgi:chromosome condensin MukBEF ATPase and DNA-binding subunit MukB
MVAHGCRTERFENSHDSAWRIIHSLSMPHPAQVLLPTEIVDDKLRINETAAGVTLNKELEKLIKAQKNASRMLEQQAKRQGNELVVHELNERKVQIDEKILQFSNQLRELKIPFSRKVHFFLNGKGKGKGK